MSDPVNRLDPRLAVPRVVPPAPARRAPEVATPTGATPSPRFSEVLGETLQPPAAGAVKFSAHALERLRERNIQLTGSDLDQIRAAVERAAAKGSRESLLVKSDLAFVVNVPNRTVITAVPGHLMKEHVFTNIDSAVLLK